MHIQGNLMIGECEMIWTAIMDCDGKSAAFSFYADNDINTALIKADSSSESDGYEIVALMKGNQTHSFYSVNRDSKAFVNSD